MRILQLKTSAARGGAESLLLDLTAGLAARGHEIRTVLGEPGWLQEQLKSQGMQVSVIPLTSMLGVIQIPRLAAVIRDSRADLVLSHGARVNLFGSAAATIVGVPAVSVEHNLDDWRFNNPVFSVLDRLMARWNAGRIAVSRAVGDMLIEKGVISGEKIVVIPNGVCFPTDDHVKDRRAVRARFGLADNDFVVVTAARLTAQKGHEYLLEALPTLVERIPGLRCLWLGDGDLRAKLEHRRDYLGLGDIVHLAGAVDRVMHILPACDLFVLPSLWEGLPVAVIEAMGMGLPVVATKVAGTPEVVESGESGLLVPPGDAVALVEAITGLFEDESLRRRFATAGRARVRAMFDIEVVKDRYEEALRGWVKT